MADPRWQVRGLADFNGDSRPDVLWHHPATGELYVWFLEGTVFRGGAKLTPNRVAAAWAVAQVADFDRDGRADLLWRNSSTGELYVWYLDGTGVVSSAYVTPDRVANPDWTVVPR